MKYMKRKKDSTTVINHSQQPGSELPIHHSGSQKKFSKSDAYKKEIMHTCRRRPVKNCRFSPRRESTLQTICLIVVSGTTVQLIKTRLNLFTLKIKTQRSKTPPNWNPQVLQPRILRRRLLLIIDQRFTCTCTVRTETTSYNHARTTDWWKITKLTMWRNFNTKWTYFKNNFESNPFW